MFSQVFKQNLRAQSIRGFRTSTPLGVQVGDKLPLSTLFLDSPGNAVDLSAEIGNSKAVIVGVPGAYSPGCSKSHVPGYLNKLRAFNEKGYSKIFVVAVNDPFVMSAWGKDLSENSISSEQVKFLSDSKGEFVGALDLKFDATKVFGNERSKRFALLIEDGSVKQAFVEPDNAGINVSDSEKVLQQA